MQTKIIHTLYCIVLLTLFTGCIPPQEKVGRVSCGVVNYDNLSDNVLDFKKLSREVVSDLLASKKIEPESVMLVTEFVDLTTLRNNNKFGFLMTNYVKNEIINTQKGIIVYEVDMASSLKIGEEGLKLLSRKAEELSLSQTLRSHYAMVGTYTTSPDRLFVSVHLVNLKNQVIEGAFTKDIPMTCETKTFF